MLKLRELFDNYNLKKKVKKNIICLGDKKNDLKKFLEDLFFFFLFF